VQVRRCGPEEFGSAAGRTPLPVGLVAITQHQPESRWRPRRLMPAKAALELMEFVIPVEREPDMVLNALQMTVQNAVVVKGWRGEADEAAHALLAAVEEAVSAVPALAA
jgi:hypothetical protein